MSEESRREKANPGSSNEEEDLPASRRPVSRFHAFTYALPAMAINALGMPIAMVLPHYYATHVGFSLATTGYLFLIARLWDMFTDPLIGRLMDRTESRFGRRKLWLLIALPLFIAGIWAVFSAPPGSGYIRFILAMFLLYIAYTMTLIAHSTWGSELAPSYDERSRLHGWREGFGLTGMMLALTTPLLFVSLVIPLIGSVNTELAQDLRNWLGSGDAASARLVGWYLAIAALLTFSLSLWFTPEHKKPRSAPLPFKKAIRFLLDNGNLQRVLIADAMSWLAPGITAALFFFLADSVLLLSSHKYSLLAVYFLASILVLPIWVSISYSIGKHKTLVLTALYNCLVTPTVLILPENNIGLAYIFMTFAGFGYGSMPFLIRAMIADVSEEDEAHHGEARWGLITSLHLVSSKIGAALALLAFPILGLFFGVDPQLGTDNSEVAKSALLYTFAIAPIVLNAATAFVIWRYRLDRQTQEDNQKLLLSKNAEKRGKL